MAYDEGLAQRLRELFLAHSDVTEKESAVLRIKPKTKSRCFVNTQHDNGRRVCRAHA